MAMYLWCGLGLTTNSSVRIHLQTNPYYLRNIDEKQFLPGLPFTSVVCLLTVFKWYFNTELLPSLCRFKSFDMTTNASKI